MMKYLAILSIVFVCTQCTIEKRLYNRGFHVEWKHNSLKSQSSSNHEVSEIRTDDNLQERNILDEPIPEISTLPTNEIAPIAEIQEGNSVPTDTVYYSVAKKQKVWDKERKKGAIIGVGGSFLLVGLVAAGTLSEATAAGANFFTFFVFGAIGWISALIAFILLLILIVLICIPPKDPLNPKEKKVEESKWSKSEKTGLVVTFAFIGLVALAFLFTGLNN